MRRISIFANDPGNHIWNTIRQAGCAVRVTLDGVDQQNAITADEDAGYLVRQVADPIGAIRAGQWPVETVLGKVKIEIVTPVATSAPDQDNLYQSRPGRTYQKRSKRRR